MSENICDICNKRPAAIRVAGEGSYCLKCHNRMMSEKLGIEDYEHTERFTVVEQSGIYHNFRISRIVLSNLVNWEAEEVNGGYYFSFISGIDEESSRAERSFLQKITDGVHTKSLLELDAEASNVLNRNGRIFTLKDKGTINIKDGADGCNDIGFEIDGQFFTPKELSELLGTHLGFSLQYRICDMYEPVLKEDTYLVPTEISRDSLIEELETVIEIHGENGFISYKDTAVFDYAFFGIIHKLEVLKSAGKTDDALAAGKAMVSILSKVYSDDDSFPEHNMRIICDTVDPFEIHGELQQIMKAYYEGL